jgi:2-dehydro-3-deoxyphosphooctonate aldolase (KDO 8-P synthase)
MKKVSVSNVTFGGKDTPLIAGPCVVETYKLATDVAKQLVKIGEKTNTPIVYKSSFDKANRSSNSSYRGPGIEKGLEALRRVKNETNLPVLTDIHEVHHVKEVAEVADILQIPAFLCRQTDLIKAAAQTGKVVNVKKGQFLSPWEIENVIIKITEEGNENILITERGTQFGYNNLVVDMRSIPIMQEFGFPVIFDATHSNQLPGGNGTSTAGMRNMVPYLAKAAVAVGCDGLFFETHPNPKEAKSDASTQWPLDELEEVISNLKMKPAKIVESKTKSSADLYKERLDKKLKSHSDTSQINEVDFDNLPVAKQKRTNDNGFLSTAKKLMEERNLTESVSISSVEDLDVMKDKKAEAILCDGFLDTLNPVEVDLNLVTLFNSASRLIFLQLEPSRRPMDWWVQKFQFLRERHDQKELDIFVVFKAEPNRLRMITLPKNYYQKKEEEERESKVKRLPLVRWNNPENKPKPRL